LQWCHEDLNFIILANQEFPGIADIASTAFEAFSDSSAYRSKSSCTGENSEVTRRFTHDYLSKPLNKIELFGILDRVFDGLDRPGGGEPGQPFPRRSTRITHSPRKDYLNQAAPRLWSIRKGRPSWDLHCGH
jgi:hypothetical protein